MAGVPVALVEGVSAARTADPQQWPVEAAALVLQQAAVYPDLAVGSGLPPAACPAQHLLHVVGVRDEPSSRLNSWPETVLAAALPAGASQRWLRQTQTEDWSAA